MPEILHIARRADWEAAAATGEYRSERDVVHCCRPSQLGLVARLHFAGQRDLLLLHLESDDVAARIVWAEYAGVQESFPHVRGPIPLEAVRRFEEFDPDSPPRPAFSPAWYRVFLDPIPVEITRAELDFVVRHFPLPAHRELIDVCCGPGRHANRLAERGYRVLGVDENHAAIAAAQRAATEGAEYAVADMRELDQLDRSFDGVLNLWHSFGYFDEDTNRAVLAGMRRALRDGGRLLLDVYNRDHMLGLPAQELVERGAHRVRTERSWSGRRLRVTLDYEGESDGVRDELEWHLYAPAELRQLADSVGFEPLLTCAWFDENLAASAEHARMQLLFEKRA